jgi:hypothetical protein
MLNFEWQNNWSILILNYTREDVGNDVILETMMASGESEENNKKISVKIAGLWVWNQDFSNTKKYF